MLRQTPKPEEIVHLIKKDIADGKLFKQPEAAADASSSESDEETISSSIAKPSCDDSQLIRAKWLVQNSKVVHVPQCKAFNVLNESGTPYLIQLYPKPTCSCKAQSQCCHIMAVQLSLGIDIKEDKKVPNLSKLRRNNRDGHKTGRKMRDHKK